MREHASKTIMLVKTPEPLASCFDRLGITAVTYAHPPVFTVEEGQGFKSEMPGGHTKNLFLKDKKGHLCLVTALSDTVIDLKWLPKRINMGRFSFGSADLLGDVLNVTPGSVTPLALMHDTDQRVQCVLDARLMDCDVVNVHPFINDKTTALSPQDLVLFLKDVGHDPMVIDFE